MTARDQRVEALLASLCARVNAVEQQLGSTSQLAGQLNTFAAQIAANEARLEERLLEMANAASVEQRLLQAKLETVEATFQPATQRSKISKRSSLQRQAGPRQGLSLRV